MAEHAAGGRPRGQRLVQLVGVLGTRAAANTNRKPERSALVLADPSVWIVFRCVELQRRRHAFISFRDDFALLSAASK
jgi:hypothetical protein